MALNDVNAIRLDLAKVYSRKKQLLQHKKITDYKNAQSPKKQ